MIRAITFDFWNTLFVAVNANASRCRKIREALAQAGYRQITLQRVEQAVTRVWREWDRVWEQEQRTFGAERWTALLLSDLGVDLAARQREALVQAMTVSGIEAHPPLVDGLDTLLPRLAARYRLGVICDTGLSPGWLLRRWMAQHDVLRYFDHLTFSDELGVSKPHPGAFLDTLAHLDVPPEAAVHVGDYPRTDIAGAQAVGMRAIQFTGVRDWETDDAIRPDASITSFAELEPLLSRWN